MSRATEDRLLDIIEYFIGMRTGAAQQPQGGFSQPDMRQMIHTPVDPSMEPEEAEDARWEAAAGLLDAHELEKALAASEFLNTEIEINHPDVT